jgi:excisionase family DNA binding protein
MNLPVRVCVKVMREGTKAHVNLNAPVLTVKEVCNYLRIHHTTLYRLLKRGQIPGYKVGSDWRFDLESLEQWRMASESKWHRLNTPYSAAMPGREVRVAPRPRLHSPLSGFRGQSQHTQEPTSEGPDSHFPPRPRVLRKRPLR